MLYLLLPFILVRIRNPLAKALGRLGCLSLGITFLFLVSIAVLTGKYVQQRNQAYAFEGERHHASAGYPYKEEITAAAEENGLDPLIFASQIFRESKFDPLAVSPGAGAKGLGQLMPDTISWCGITDPFDANANLDCSARYMRYMVDLTGDVADSLGSYYRGPTGFKTFRASGLAYAQLILGPVPPYPPNTSYRITQDFHGGSGLLGGVDYATACGQELRAPLTGVVTYNGCDGYVGPFATREGVCGFENTIIIFESTVRDDRIALLHGIYDESLTPGTEVIAGYTYIGTSSDQGNATGCHEHYSLRQNNQFITPIFPKP